MDEYQVHNIALKILKQRCEYLQQRLITVEEENCKLKLEKALDSSHKTLKDPNSLEEQIIILSKEKSQMAHRIQMITDENSTLWSQLSKILPENNISSLKFSVSVPSDNQGLKLSQFDSILNDYSKGSLEEISLKLINGIMGKNELEKQFFQMVDLQKENIKKNNSSFLTKQCDNRTAVKNFKDYVLKLKEFKQVLFKQKSDLLNTILFIKNSPIFSKHNKNVDYKDITKFNYLSSSKESDFKINKLGSEPSTLQETDALAHTEVKPGVDICPMCGKNFTELFIDFYQHVSRHFYDESEECTYKISNVENTE